MATLRQLGDRLAGRPAPPSDLVEQVGMSGAAAGSRAVAAKAVAMCLALGGTATFCLKAADHQARLPVKAHATKPTTPRHRVVEPDRAHVTVVRLPEPRPKPKAHPKAKAPAPKQPPVSSRRYKPAASPAPQGSTEFGPGSLGSTSAPKQPAAAPTDGGGEFAP